MMKRMQYLMAVLVGFVFVLGGVANVFGQPEGSLLDEIQKRGVIKVGMFLQYPPTEFRDPVTREPKGMDVDIANILAKDLGVELEIIDMEWEAMIAGLIAKKYDIILASMARTPKRNLSIAMTSKNIENFWVMGLVQPNDKRTTIAEFNKKGVIVTCALGAIAEHAAKRFFPNATIKPMTMGPATLEVVAGRADMLISENTYIYNYLKTNPGKAKSVFEKDPLTHEPAAIGLRKGDQIFLNWLDNWIQYQWDNRIIQELTDKWIKGIR